MEKWTVENYYQITDVDGTGARALLFFEKSFHTGTNADGNDYATIVVRLDKVMLTEAGSGDVDRPLKSAIRVLGIGSTGSGLVETIGTTAAFRLSAVPEDRKASRS
ncbi:MAG: hypothetical protein V8R49_01365 [Duodenibacillus massiliensis]